MWGTFDIRWAEAYTPPDRYGRRYDTDIDIFKQKDLDQKYLCV